MRMRLGMALMAVSWIAAAQQAPARLEIVVTEGEGAINNVKQRTAREAIVQVDDENHRPVAGAAVIFLLPGDGPGGTFVGGAKTAALMTDAKGQAVMPRMIPNQLNGRFQIHVTASYQGTQTSTNITQLNEGGGGGAGGAHAGISGKTIGIIVAVAAAGAIGAAVGLRGSGNSNNSNSNTPPPTPTGTISLGSGVTVGPPH